MEDPSVGPVIVRHIDDLEAALRYEQSSMKPALGKAVAEIFESHRKANGWAGKVAIDLDDPVWIALNHWRTANSSNDSFDLFFELRSTNCIDGNEPATWVGAFCGFAGAGIRININSNALGWRPWKALLRAEASAFVNRGYFCDPKEGVLALPISIDRDALAEAFAEDDFTTALRPIGAALDKIKSEEETFDRFVSAIREKS